MPTAAQLLTTAAQGAGGTVRSAIAAASQKTGIDFNYLLGQAQIESGMRSNARAAGSSATGLYQFIEQSWLRVVKAHGAEHGLGWAAKAISIQGGRATVDPALRQQILALRSNPAAASAMAAAHASDNKDALEGALGRSATGTDLYMAHFLGLGGAKTFLKSMAANPDRIGASMFPAAARANRSVFYAANGQPRTLGQIYARFADKLDRGAKSAGGSGVASAAIESGPTVIAGSGDTQSSAARWAQAALDTINGTASTMDSILRPGPKTAQLAYMLLAGMGGR